jgi:hypothetical protein
MKFTSKVTSIQGQGKSTTALEIKYIGHKWPSVKRELTDTIQTGAEKLAKKFLAGQGGVREVKQIKAMLDCGIYDFQAIAQNGAVAEFSIWKDA